MPMEIFRRNEKEIMELELNSEKHQQNSRKLRATKEDTQYTEVNQEYDL